MIREVYWKNLESANREMIRCLERLRKVRAGGDVQEIKRAEMAYFQALQLVYEAGVDAVADGNREFR